MSTCKCTACQAEISCTPHGACWCSTLPALISPEPESLCLCQPCLIKKLAAKVNKNPKILSTENVQKIADLGAVMQPINEVDYYKENIDGRELIVFTSWYLLRRGYCCDNNCRNCPYPKQNI